VEDRIRNGTVDLVLERLGPAAVSMMLWPAGFLDALIAQDAFRLRLGCRLLYNRASPERLTANSPFEQLVVKSAGER
jgi:hypothetical protein